MAVVTDKNISNAPQVFADGWYFHFRSQNIGPISLRELKGRHSAGELKPSDLAWHAAAGAWMPIRDVLQLSQEQAAPPSAMDEEIVRRLRRGDRLVVRNALYLVLTAVPGLIFLLAASSMLSHQDSEAFGMLLALIALMLVWWAWLEFRGVRFAAEKIVFAARLPFWPSIIPYRMTAIELRAVTGADYATINDHTHVVVLKGPAKNFMIPFDSIFARDSFLFVLSLRSVPISSR